MSYPPKNNDSGGNGSSGSAIALALSAPAIMNVGEIAKVPFNVIAFNDGFTYSAVTQEITIAIAGTLIINGTVGCEKEDDNTSFALTCFLFKNGLPLRQNAKASSDAPYASAALSIIDKCVVGDKYVLYATRTAKATYSLVATDGLTGLEMAYL